MYKLGIVADNKLVGQSGHDWIRPRRARYLNILITAIAGNSDPGLIRMSPSGLFYASVALRTDRRSSIRDPQTAQTGDR